MKRILFCVGLLVAGGVLNGMEGQAPVTATPAESENFFETTRQRLRDLDQEVHQAYDARRIERLGALAAEARQEASQVESFGNVRFGSVVLFRRQFNNVARDADFRADQLRRSAVRPPRERIRSFDDEQGEILGRLPGSEGQK